MVRTRKLMSYLAVLLIGLTFFIGCRSVGVHVGGTHSAGHGPPPHAPAHGYRHKYEHGIDLTYDSGLGVYVVVGYPDHYFLDGRYYRLGGGRWETSQQIAGPWVRADDSTLPPGLGKK